MKTTMKATMIAPPPPNKVVFTRIMLSTSMSQNCFMKRRQDFWCLIFWLFRNFSHLFWPRLHMLHVEQDTINSIRTWGITIDIVLWKFQFAKYDNRNQWLYQESSNILLISFVYSLDNMFQYYQYVGRDYFIWKFKNYNDRNYNGPIFNQRSYCIIYIGINT